VSNPAHQRTDKVTPETPIDTSDHDDDDDDDDDDRDGLRNVGLIRTCDAADSPRRLHQIQSPRKLKNLKQGIV
jgi:hypothetical protein